MNYAPSATRRTTSPPPAIAVGVATGPATEATLAADGADGAGIVLPTLKDPSALLR